MDDTRSSLLRRIRDRADRSGWSEFDRLYRPLLIRYARLRGVGAEQAEEVAQHCLTILADRMTDFRRRRSFRGWLKRMVEHKVADHFRDRRRREKLLHVTAREEGSNSNPGEDSWQRQWNRTHLRYCLARLREDFSPHTLAAFELYVLQGLPVRDIAARLGMTRGQIYVAKARVLRRLRARFAHVMESLYRGV